MQKAHDITYHDVDGDARRHCLLGGALEPRNHKRLLFALCWVFVSAISLAQTAPEPRIKFGPEGRPICEDYFKLLSRTKPNEQLPLCSAQVDQLPGAKPLDWEELDIPRNLELLHKMEWLLRSHIKPEPAHEFKDWLKQFQRRAKKPASLPRIKQSRVTVEPDQPPQLVYSYEEAGPSCSRAKLAAWKKGFGAFLLFDDEIQRGRGWNLKSGTPFVYDNRFHLFYSYLSDKTHFWEWAAVIETFDGKNFRRGEYSDYQSTHVCGFSDSKIFYLPPRR